jgi:hypothetical protein
LYAIRPAAPDSFGDCAYVSQALLDAAMRHRFLPLLLPLTAGLLLSACAGQAPKRQGAGTMPSEQWAAFLADCQRREQLQQPRSVDCPRTQPQAAQPGLEPLMPPLTSLPTLPGGLIR